MSKEIYFYNRKYPEYEIIKIIVNDEELIISKDYKKISGIYTNYDISCLMPSENEYYIQGSDHYLIPKDVFKELFNEMENWKEESEKQKEVIDKAIEFTNKNWGTWCTHHIEYMTELQNILKEVSE